MQSINGFPIGNLATVICPIKQISSTKPVVNTGYKMANEQLFYHDIISGNSNTAILVINNLNDLCRKYNMCRKYVEICVDLCRKYNLKTICVQLADFIILKIFLHIDYCDTLISQYQYISQL